MLPVQHCLAHDRDEIEKIEKRLAMLGQSIKKRKKMKVKAPWSPLSPDALSCS